MSRRRWLRAALLASLATPASGARAQGTATLVGWVRDVGGRVVYGALVSIPSRSAAARTDSGGTFALRGMEPGHVLLVIRRLGFAPESAELDLHAGIPDSVAIKLSTSSAQMLAPVRIEERERRQQELEGFYRRRAKGEGLFFVREDFAARQPTRLTDMLRGERGVEVVRLRNGRVGLRFGRYAARATDCAPQLWVDGQRARGAELDDFPPQDLEAMELYPGPASTPMEYRDNTTLGCGTIVIWTRLPGLP